MMKPETFPIIKGMPIRRARCAYPFEQMEIGDCFDAPDNMGAPAGDQVKSERRRSILASARNYKASSGLATFKVSTAALCVDGVNVIRCQRVS